MKKLIFIAILYVFLATPSLADIYVGIDDIVQTDDVGPNYSYASGGEFTIYNSNLSINAYVSDTSGIYGGANSFQTFCVEVIESVGTPVDVVLSTTFINESDGSYVGPGSHAIKGGQSFGDNLDPRTAYLYTEFVKGTLSNYDYDGTMGIGRNISARDLQKAIWIIEGEQLPSSATTQAQAWIDEANAAAWNDIGQVRILNLYEANTYKTGPVFLQDMLYMLPVPGAVLLCILGLGVAGLKLRKYA
jgi:hypothetical protein